MPPNSPRPLWATDLARPSSRPGLRPSAALGVALKRIEREDGPEAALATMAAALAAPGPAPDSAVQAHQQCSAILDWASRADHCPPDSTHGPAPASLGDLGDSLHPKAILARRFMILALEGPDACARGAAEQLAGHEELCARWRAGPAAEPYPIDKAFRLWARMSPAWMLCDAILCRPMLAALENEPELRGAQMREELAGRPWLCEALGHWKGARDAYHKDFVKEFFSGASGSDAKAMQTTSFMTRGGSEAVGKNLATQLRIWTKVGFQHSLISSEDDPEWLRKAAHALSGVDMNDRGATSAFVAEAERVLLSWIMPEQTDAPKARPQRI